MPISISLRNFRCWEDKTLDFPEKGLCLLHGRSGKGKSSILNAFVYAITGKGRNITTFHKKSSSVQITIDDLLIKRQRGPNRLTVERAGITHEDDVAQAIIDSVFGKEFCQVSYIDQDNVNSFVTLSPSEKFDFLERLLLDEGIDKIKERIRREISDTKDQCTAEDARLGTLRDLLKKMSRPEPVILSIGDRTVSRQNFTRLLEKADHNLDVSQRNLQSCCSRIKKIETDIRESARRQERRNQLQGKIEELQRQMSQLTDSPQELEQERKRCEDARLLLTRYAEFLRYVAVRDRYEETIKTLSTEREKRKAEVDALPSRETVERSITQLTKAVAARDRIVDIQDSLDVLGQPLSEQEISLQSTDLEEMRQQQASLKERITQSQSCYECPECQISLQFCDKRLVRSSTRRDDVSTLSDELTKLQQTIRVKAATVDEHRGKRQQCDQMSGEYDRLLESFDELCRVDGQVVADDALDEALQEWTHRLARHRELADAIRRIDNDRYVSEMRKELDTFRVKDAPSPPEGVTLESVQDRLAAIRSMLARRCELEREHEMSQREYEGLSMQDVDAARTALDKERERKEGYDVKIQHYRTNVDSLKAWQQHDQHRGAYEEMMVAISDADRNRHGLGERLRCLIVLRDHVKRAEQQCISDFIDSLNQHATSYLSDFFPDDDIQVELTTLQEGKSSGKEKVAIHFQVTYREMTGDLSFLSGGERDRVNLAFTLAFSELVDNRILMLDECISSLDSETTNVVLEQIREKYKGKLVLIVSHQANLGFFDHVIEID